MTDYVGVTWRVNYGELGEQEQFRVGYVGVESYDAYFPISQLTDLINTLNAVVPLGLELVAKGSAVQARKVSGGNIVSVVIEPRLDTGTPSEIMRLYLTDLTDLVYALSLLQSALPSNPEPDDWDGTRPWVLGPESIPNYLQPTALDAATIEVALPAVSILKYGTPMGLGDQTAAVNQVIDEVSAGGGGILSMPPYLITAEPILKSNVRIIGQGHGRSVIKAVAGSSRRGIVTIDQTGGPVRRCSLTDVSISGNGNPNQWGMFIKGSPGLTDPFDGGLWYSDFERIRITNTIAGGILLQGGGVSSLLPQQFLNFRSISIQQTTGTYPNWVGLRIAGQVGQAHFDQIEVSYRGTNFQDNNNYGKCGLYISREIDDSGAIISDKYPYALVFTACTFQGCAIGARVDRCLGASFIGCYWEDNQNGILAEQSCSGVVVVSPHFADTGSDGNSTGYIAQVTGSAFLTIIDPTIIGAYDRSWINSSGSGHLDLIHGHNASTNIVNFPKQFTAAGTLTINNEKFIAIGGAAEVTSFSATLDPEDILVVQLTSDVTFNGSTGNIRFPTGALPSSNTWTFQSGARLLFKFSKSAGLFTLISDSDRILNRAAYNAEGANGLGFYRARVQATDPVAPDSGHGVLFTRVVAGKMQWCARFPTGAVQVIAAEP